MNKGISKEDLNKIKNILDEIETSPVAYDFVVPVDFVGIDMINQLKIIFFNFNSTWIRRLSKDHQKPNGHFNYKEKIE